MLPTIVGAAALHDRERDGNGWDDRAWTTRIPLDALPPGVKRETRPRFEIVRARGWLGAKSLAVSTAWLQRLPAVDLPPLQQVIFLRPSQLALAEVSSWGEFRA